MSDNNTYIGLTIGPIYKTLSNVRQTRELWAASYFFSRIMKDIIGKLRPTHGEQFIIPYVDIQDENDLFTGKKQFKGAGLFADRLIFEKKNKNDLQILTDAINHVVKKLSSEIANDLGITQKVNEVEKFLHEYLQLYVFEKEVKGNPIFEINEALDVAELKNTFLQKEEKYLAHAVGNKKKHFTYLENYLDKTNKTAVIEKVFANKDEWGLFQFLRKMEFPTISDISTLELAIKYTDLWLDIKDKEYEKRDSGEKFDLVVALKNELTSTNKGDDFKFRNKYFCIVNADGDNIGKTIKGLGEKDDKQKRDKGLKDFSKALFGFAEESAETISKFGGKSVYIGGDDLLFFAPVVSPDDTTIFDLVQKLSEIFDEKIEDIFNDSGATEKPTLSFGVSMSYHKFPLYEALEISRGQLFEVAKKHIGIDREKDKKNAISFKILKHSGQSFGATMGKEQASFKKFHELITNGIGGDKIFTSILYKLQDTAEILGTIAWEELKKENNRLEERIKNFFDNYFNESIHKTEEGIKFKKEVAELLYFIYIETPRDRTAEDGNANYIKKASETIYGTLRTIHFIQQDDQDER